jgi:hypothetical protein
MLVKDCLEVRASCWSAMTQLCPSMLLLTVTCVRDVTDGSPVIGDILQRRTVQHCNSCTRQAVHWLRRVSELNAVIMVLLLLCRPFATNSGAHAHAHLKCILKLSSSRAIPPPLPLPLCVCSSSLPAAAVCAWVSNTSPCPVSLLVLLLVSPGLTVCSNCCYAISSWF